MIHSEIENFNICCNGFYMDGNSTTGSSSDEQEQAHNNGVQRPQKQKTNRELNNISDYNQPASVPETFIQYWKQEKSDDVFYVDDIQEYAV